jgi:hypothetical protein
MFRITDWLSRGLHLHAADVGNDLPNLFVGHANADAAVGGGRHSRARDAIVNVVEDFGVGIAMTLLRARQIRSAAAAARAETVAESAVQPELIFTELGDFRITGIRILFLGRQRPGQEEKYKREDASKKLARMPVLQR